MLVAIPCLSLLLLLAGGLLTLRAAPAQAHDIYLDVVDGAGQSCCDNRDCRPANYRMTEGGVQMFIYGHWLVIPHDKIQY